MQAVRLWASEPDDGEGHAHVVCRYFQHGPENGWEKIKTMVPWLKHAETCCSMLKLKQAKGKLN